MQIEGWKNKVALFSFVFVKIEKSLNSIIATLSDTLMVLN